jgi:hypothetical protein
MGWYRLTVGFLILSLSYLLFSGQASADEIGFGAGCVAASTVWCALVLRVAPHRLRLSTTATVLVFRSLAALPIRTVRVGGALVWTVIRGAGGPGVSARAFEPGRADDEHDAGRRAAVVLGLSLTPDSFVLDVPAHRNEIDLHQLVAAPTRGDARWPA